MSFTLEHKINPPVVFEISDAKAGLTGWLAIDSTINNHSCGGLRIVPDTSASEMMELAKVMTLKYGFLGLPHGGAKAGIFYDERLPRENKLILLTAFGRKIKNFLSNRIYYCVCVNIYPTHCSS